VDTIWDVKDVGGNRQSKAEIKKLFPNVPPFDTPKPERLLQRIIHVGTEPGDIVLDCFLGSGTTAAVAHKMGRRWVGIEFAEDTVATFALRGSPR
jgi:adenine specific DNA methylase Mod